jgi:hypothetical protein
VKVPVSLFPAVIVFLGVSAARAARTRHGVGPLRLRGVIPTASVRRTQAGLARTG